MRHLKAMRLVVLIAALLAMFGAPHIGAAQLPNYPLENCARGCFSTEEDFMMMQGEPYDGNPYISDGDLLSRDGTVCARNADLLRAFYPDGSVPYDLGLDAVDVLDITDRIVAFSTEIDDPGKHFTAGDLLLTNGSVIPNTVLVSASGINYDIGLDALQFIGTQQGIIGFVNRTMQIDREQWTGTMLQTELKAFNVDIWFSIEGTFAPAGAAMILDGDLLKATGGVVVKQADLLPATVPAGLPVRGVDFGLDAVAAPRLEVVTHAPPLYFSTEILYRGQDLGFTDGDVLAKGNGVVVTNRDLIAAFGPAADFLGLDALDIGSVDEAEPEPRITHIGQVSVADINGGSVPIGGPGTGLAYSLGYERPFGRWVAIQGDIPTGVDEYRVVYRVVGASRPTDPATAKGIPVVPATGWQASDWNWVMFDCSGWSPYFSDADGWFDAAEYRRLESGEGMIADCNAQLALTVWNSFDTATLDTEGHYLIWLQWRVGAGPIIEEPVDHHVQFDNQPPENVALEIPGGACTEFVLNDMPIMVQGHFDDPHFWRYRLKVFGGDPPAGHYYGIVNYDDAGPEAANVSGTGTGTGFVNLHEIDVNDIPAASVVDCCYGARLWVEDRTIIGSFDPGHNTLPWGFGFEAEAEVTFAYTP